MPRPPRGQRSLPSTPTPRCRPRPELPCDAGRKRVDRHDRAGAIRERRRTPSADMVADRGSLHARTSSLPRARRAAPRRTHARTWNRARPPRPSRADCRVRASLAPGRAHGHCPRRRTPGTVLRAAGPQRLLPGRTRVEPQLKRVVKCAWPRAVSPGSARVGRTSSLIRRSAAGGSIAISLRIRGRSRDFRPWTGRAGDPIWP